MNLGHFFAELLHRNSHIWSLHEIIDKLHNLSTLGQMAHCTGNRCKINQKRMIPGNSNKLSKLIPTETKVMNKKINQKVDNIHTRSSYSTWQSTAHTFFQVLYNLLQ